MRVLEGHDLALGRARARRSFLSNLSQALPPLGPERLAIKADDLPEYWGRLAASRDGQQIVKIGQLVSNTAEYPFLPVEGFHVILFVWAGKNAGEVIFVPVSQFMKDYGILTPEYQESVLERTIRPMVKTDRTLASFYKDVTTGLSLAQDALSKARLGDLKTAKLRLEMKFGGARAIRDSASVTLRVLEDVGFFTRDEGFEVAQSILQPLTNTINDAQVAIGESSSFILSAINKVSEIAKLTAVQLRGLVGGKWGEFAKVYRDFHNAVLSLDPAIKAIEADIAFGGPRVEELKKRLEDLKKFKARLEFFRNSIEQKVVSLGVPIAEFRKEAGLGVIEIGITAAIVAVVIFTLAAIIDEILNIIKDPTYVPHSGFINIWMSKEEIAHRKTLLDVELGRGTERASLYKKVAEEAERALDRSAGSFIDFINGASSAFPGQINPDDVKKFKDKAGEMGIVLEPMSPWIYVGVVAGGFALSALIYFFLLRKE